MPSASALAVTRNPRRIVAFSPRAWTARRGIPQIRRPIVGYHVATERPRRFRAAGPPVLGDRDVGNLPGLRQRTSSTRAVAPPERPWRGRAEILAALSVSPRAWTARRGIPQIRSPLSGYHVATERPRRFRAVGPPGPGRPRRWQPSRAHTKNMEYSGWGSWATRARPMAMMRATMPSMRSVRLVLGRLEVAGGVLGDGDAIGETNPTPINSLGERICAVRHGDADLGQTDCRKDWRLRRRTSSRSARVRTAQTQPPSPRSSPRSRQSARSPSSYSAYGFLARQAPSLPTLHSR